MPPTSWPSRSPAPRISSRSHRARTRKPVSSIDTGVLEISSDGDVLVRPNFSMSPDPYHGALIRFRVDPAQFFVYEEAVGIRTGRSDPGPVRARLAVCRRAGWLRPVIPWGVPRRARGLLSAQHAIHRAQVDHAARCAHRHRLRWRRHHRDGGQHRTAAAPNLHRPRWQ